MSSQIRNLWVLSIASLALLGCSQGGSNTDSRQLSQQSATLDDSDKQPDPCGLLKVEEVEAALGKLAVPPYQIGQNGPEAGGSRCGYRTADFHGLQIGVTLEGGAALLKMMGLPAGIASDAHLRGKLPLPEFADIAGDWDEARIIGCCIINALLGDSMVDLNFSGSKLTMAQAASLVNSALARLNSPVSIDGSKGVDAALAQDARRPQPRPVCSILTRSEVQEILGPLNGEPEGSNSECVWRYSSIGTDGKSRPSPFSLKVSWVGGYADLPDEAKMSGQIMGALLGQEAKDAERIAGPWDDALASINFLAVKNDVLLRIDLRTTERPLAEKMAASVIRKLVGP